MTDFGLDRLDDGELRQLALFAGMIRCDSPWRGIRVWADALFRACKWEEKSRRRQFHAWEREVRAGRVSSAWGGEMPPTPGEDDGAPTS